MNENFYLGLVLLNILNASEIMNFNVELKNLQRIDNCA